MLSTSFGSPCRSGPSNSSPVLGKVPVVQYLVPGSAQNIAVDSRVTRNPMLSE
jgi:hypothetical protein